MIENIYSFLQFLEHRHYKDVTLILDNYPSKVWTTSTPENALQFNWTITKWLAIAWIYCKNLLYNSSGEREREGGGVLWWENVCPLASYAWDLDENFPNGWVGQKRPVECPEADVNRLFSYGNILKIRSTLKSRQHWKQSLLSLWINRPPLLASYRAEQ